MAAGWIFRAPNRTPFPETLRRRIAKGLLFATPQALPDLTLHPHPWQPSRPVYYVLHRLDDPDGHGGYTREHRFDAAGVPYSLADGRPRYDPLVVARYAMRMLAIGTSSGNAEAVRRARQQLEPLLASGELTGAWGAGDSADAMGTDRPGCLIQGVVISALIRLCDGKPSARVRHVLARAFERLAAPVAAGGTVSELEGGAFLEEYPSDPPSHVLNGCISALFGVYDLADAIGHTGAAELARGVERTLARSLNRFDTLGGWSLYALDLAGAPLLASMHYHRYHALGIKVLAERTGERTFDQYARRWARAMSRWWVRAPVAVAKIGQVVWLRDICRAPLE